MKKNILFCGTPEFAVTSLKSIFDHQISLNYNLAGVITIPDTISGRGQKKQESAIKQAAKNLGLKIFLPNNLSDSNFINNIKALNLDLIIVVAFKKLPKVLFEIPKIGTINLHASLLPQYRGAAPINWVIVNGEEKTGLTTFFINENIDTGDIILQTELNIKKTWHVDELHDKLKYTSSQIIKDTIEEIFEGSYKTKKQEEYGVEAIKYAPKINKHDRVVDAYFWNNQTIEEIYNFIRGMSPPGVKTIAKIYEKKSQKILMTQNIIITRVGGYKNIAEPKNMTQKNPIYISVEYKNEIVITDSINSFNIERLKTENGKEISAKEFYNGFLKTKNTQLKFL